VDRGDAAQLLVGEPVHVAEEARERVVRGGTDHGDAPIPAYVERQHAPVFQDYDRLPRHLAGETDGIRRL
jgi:hypothetical protein